MCWVLGGGLSQRMFSQGLVGASGSRPQSRGALGSSGSFKLSLGVNVGHSRVTPVSLLKAAEIEWGGGGGKCVDELIGLRGCTGLQRQACRGLPTGG